ncbi:MAG: ATP-dependent DNA helicase RecG, partial [Oscillospiraceae bacterium]|nr:ATP-dependent DNA helicase RecG [Oscillospiraceae bacterium]
MNPLDTPVTVLSGVGDAKAKLFAKLRISTLYDAVRHFPRDYEDRTVMRFTAQLEHGESVCVAATVEDATMTRSANGLMLVKARAHDDYGALDLYFFNQPYARDALRRGETYIFFGKVERETRTPRMVNPVFERYTETRQGTRTRCIVPVYRLTSGLSQYAVSTAVRAALTRLRDKLPDPTPPYIAERYDLVPAQYAYEQIHFPQDFDTLAAARRRLIFDELLTVAAAAQRSRLMRERVLGRRFADTDLAAFFG